MVCGLMTDSFLTAVASRDSEAQGIVHLVVGGEMMPLSITRRLIPDNSFLGSAVHGLKPATALSLSAFNADFMRLLLRFFNEKCLPKPFAACRYLILIGHPTMDTFDIGPSDTSKWYRALRQTRVTFFTREGYYEGSPVALEDLELDSAELPAAAFELQTTAPTVLNEVRVRAVEWDLPHSTVSGDGDSDKFRLVPAFAVTGSANAQTFPSISLVAHSGTTKGMEARALVLRNAPRRRLVCGGLLSEFLALPREISWREADAHAYSDLTLSLGRALLERHAKLKAFLVASHTEKCNEGLGPCRLKAWPGKDALQAMAAWWLAALLVEGHRYTEPELYAVIESECSYAPDLGTIRKELVRRGYLGPPSIAFNEDKTTSTLYSINLSGMHLMLGEWRVRGVL